LKHEETRGKVKQVAGRAKEAAGILTGSKTLENEGKQQRVEGVLQENLGKARRKVGELADDLAKAIKK